MGSTFMASELTGGNMLQSYVSDTLEYIYTVTDFINRNSIWTFERKAELAQIEDIKDLLNPSIQQVLKSENILEGMDRYVRMHVSSAIIGEELKNVHQRKLAFVLKNTLKGIQKLTDFLEAFEKLAVTCVHVFTAGEDVVKLSLGISLQSIEEIISAARLVCPRLLDFKRDAGAFLQLSFHNNEAVFAAELKRCIHVTEEICSTMKISLTPGIGNDRRRPPAVVFADDVAEKDMQRIIFHVQELSAIRKDQNFRLTFLFQEKNTTGFVNQFTDCHPRMLQILDDMEESAIQLDRMMKGSKISSIAGSSVGIIGNVLTITGLALAPLSAGVSMGLTLGGLGLGLTSSINTAVTKGTEISVNKPS